MSIRKYNDKSASQEVLQYSIGLTLNTAIAIILSLTICLFSGHLFNCLLAIIFLIIVRYFGGGLHLSSYLSCCIFSTVIIVISAHIEFKYSLFFVLIDLFSTSVLFIKAPQGIDQVSTISKNSYKYLKLTCVLLVSSNFFIQSPTLSFIFFVQACLTTNTSYYLKDIIEEFFSSKLPKGGELK